MAGEQTIKGVAFDAYGTLFDVYSVGALAEGIFPGSGKALAELWRDRCQTARKTDPQSACNSDPRLALGLGR